MTSSKGKNSSSPLWLRLSIDCFYYRKAYGSRVEGADQGGYVILRCLCPNFLSQHLLILVPRADIKAEPNKSGGGEGQWSAWKVRSPISHFCNSLFSVKRLVLSRISKAWNIWAEDLFVYILDWNWPCTRLQNSPRSMRSKVVIMRRRLEARISLRRESRKRRRTRYEERFSVQ